MVHRLGFFVLALSTPVLADDVQPYIIGGDDATGDWPWAALVEIDFGAQGRGACSGSLLSPDQVLTTAHCFFDENGQQVDASAITVHVGSAPNGANSTHAADIYHLHSGYDNTANPIGNDIALIQLSSAIDVSPLPSLVDGTHFDELLTRDAPGRDEALTAIGWGATTTDRNNQAVSPTLQQVALDYVPFSTCNQSWNGFLTPVQSSVICAAELNPQDNEIENTCLGDSGGPLILGDDPAPYIVGLTSFGSADSCQGGRPTVFTRVLNMVDFVEENVPLVDVSVSSDPQRYYGSPGGQVTVPATVTNGSLRNTAHNVTIQANTDDASADASLQWSDCGSGGLLAGNDQCTLTPPLTAGADSSGQVEVNHNGATETDATLTLEVGSDEDEYRIKNNQAPITVVFSNRPDLTVSAEQTAGNLDSDGQGIATVVVRVSNLSTVNAASNATVELTLPAGTTARGDDTVQCDTLCWVGPMGQRCQCRIHSDADQRNAGEQHADPDHHRPEWRRLSPG